MTDIPLISGNINVSQNDINRAFVRVNDALATKADGSGNSTGTNTGDQLVFKTIAVAGQGNVMADSTADTLTLVAGTNVTITTNAGTDTITIASNGAANAFTTIAVSGQADIVADAATDTLTMVAGTNVTLTTDAGTDTLTINAAGSVTDSFKTIAVAGQSSVIADNATDTLTLAAGSNITITTDAGTDTVTIAAAGGGSVTSVSVTTANGVSGTVANPTTTPAISLALGAITPTSVAATGAMSGSNLSGTNTGDQTNITGNAGTATALQTPRTISGTSFDGTANISLATTGVTEGTNLYFTDARARTAAVQDAIVDGVTTIAPSQNAVFDALATKVSGSGASSGTNTGDQLVFKTIAVSGQADVVADTITDTLTLAAGSGITITTDASTDTVTIAASASGTVTSVSVVTANGLSGTVANPTTTPALTLSLNSTGDTLTTTGNIGTSSGTGVSVIERGSAINHSTKFTFTNTVVNITDNGVTGGSGSLLIYTFPAGTWLPLASTGKLTLTTGAGGITDTASLEVYFTRDPATANPDYFGAASVILAAGTATVRHTFPALNTVGSFSSHADDVDSFIFTTMYIRIDVPNTLDISANDTVTVSGTVNINWQSIGNDIP